MKLPARAGHLALVLSLAFVAAAGCGPTAMDDGSGGSNADTDEDGSGGEGEDGSGGTAEDGSGGEGGEDGSGGEGEDGSGGEGEDGSGGTPSGGSGGSGGTPSGGSGGTDPTGECGDDAVDALEQCDGGEGCSDECTLEACDTCRAAECAFGENGDAYSQYASCAETPLSAEYQAICLDVLTCARESGCTSSFDGDHCFCGDVDGPECLTASNPLVSPSPGNGPCKDLIHAATRTYLEFAANAPASLPTNNVVAEHWFALASPSGIAMVTVDCEESKCASECGHEPATGSGGSGGSGGSSGSGGAEGSGGSGGSTSTPAGCFACSNANCGAERSHALVTECDGFSSSCLTYQNCIYDSKCAVGASDPEAGLVACYCDDVSEGTCFAGSQPAYPSVACQSAVEGVASTTTPSQIDLQWADTSEPLGAMNDLFLCEATLCEEECAVYYGAP